MAVGDESPLRMFKARRRLSAEAAAQPEATRSKAANELASELQAPNVPYRATSSMSGSQADIAELERPDSYTPVSSMVSFLIFREVLISLASLHGRLSCVLFSLCSPPNLTKNSHLAGGGRPVAQSTSWALPHARGQIPWPQHQSIW